MLLSIIESFANNKFYILEDKDVIAKNCRVIYVESVFQVLLMWKWTLTFGVLNLKKQQCIMENMVYLCQKVVGCS